MDKDKSIGEVWSEKDFSIDTRCRIQDALCKDEEFRIQDPNPGISLCALRHLRINVLKELSTDYADYADEFKNRFWFSNPGFVFSACSATSADRRFVFLSVSAGEKTVLSL